MTLFLHVFFLSLRLSRGDYGLLEKYSLLRAQLTFVGGTNGSICGNP